MRGVDQVHDGAHRAVDRVRAPRAQALVEVVELGEVGLELLAHRRRVAIWDGERLLQPHAHRGHRVGHRHPVRLARLVLARVAARQLEDALAQRVIRAVEAVGRFVLGHAQRLRVDLQVKLDGRLAHQLAEVLQPAQVVHRVLEHGEGHVAERVRRVDAAGVAARLEAVVAHQEILDLQPELAGRHDLLADGLAEERDKPAEADALVDPQRRRRARELAKGHPHVGLRGAPLKRLRLCLRVADGGAGAVERPVQLHVELDHAHLVDEDVKGLGVGVGARGQVDLHQRERAVAHAVGPAPTTSDRARPAPPHADHVDRRLVGVAGRDLLRERVQPLAAEPA